MKKLIHHKFSEIFPMMNEEEKKDLVLSIKESGLRDPILLFQGKILDGRNRYESCLEAKVDPKFIQFTGTEEEAQAYVFDVNYTRRHLTDAQRACCAAERMQQLKMTRGDQAMKANDIRWNKANVPTRAKGAPRLLEILAEQLKVGQGRLKDANTLLLNNKPLFDKCKAGELAIRHAYRMHRKRIGSKPCSHKKAQEFTAINLDASKSIIIPAPDCNQQALNSFIETMVVKGWRFELKITPMMRRNTKLGPVFQANWYGNGHISNYTAWRESKCYESIQEALLQEAHVKLDPIHGKQTEPTHAELLCA
jgi:hypothetical protein